ncbi:hypothetical protein [Hyphomonas chukchiensis]|nr:hypothetical protein [Hyphomonas chukchiensis]|tara:strand:- start:2386 stop:3099 length:714 start_codon:yes stop_codon:yes gene_type:complete
MRVFAFASLWVLLLCAPAMASAQSAAASSTDDIIEVVETLCIDTGLDATKAWMAATDAGWVKVPTSVIDPYIWGIKPHYRVGARAQDGSGFLLILSAQGQITAEQRRRFYGGLVTEGSPVKPGVVLSYPFMQEPSDSIGGRNCRLDGNVDDPYSLRDRVEALEINSAGFQLEFDEEAYGEGPDTGKYKHNTSWSAPDALMNLSIGKMREDGSYPFSLSLGSAIAIDSEPSSYIVKID